MSFKKRLLAFILVAAMVLNWIPAAASAERFTESLNGSSGGRLGLTASSGDREQVSGFAPGNTGGLTKFEQSGLLPFSDSKAASEFDADDLVTFIVVLDSVPLLEKFSAEEIAEQTEAVQQHQAAQEAAIAAVQGKVLATFGMDEGFKLGFEYTVGTVGFSVTTAFGNLHALLELPGVKTAYVAPVYEVPESGREDSLSALTSNATNMVGADILNELGYTGRGQRIAILDTGILVDHPSFAALPDEALLDPMTRDSVDKIWEELNAGQMAASLNLSYYNSKLPFIFNYVAGNFNVSNTFAGSDHGTHVAGIAAANRTEDSEVVGVAPDAQLVVMQVFQQGGGASFDTIMAALEDCILLEVDTVNLSLGMAAGFYDPDDEMLQTLQLFLESDIQLLIASGNDTNNAYMNNWGYDMSLITNPDIGLAGTPSTYSAALAVASVDNDGYEQLYITVGGVDYGYLDTATAEGTIFLNAFRDRQLEYVMVPGFGEEADYEGIDVTDKVAVISRGTTSFPEKQAMAQEKGAIACIIYNNDRGIFAMQINDGDGAIPAISVSREAGAALAEAVGENGVGTLKVCNADMKVFKVNQTVSVFSSQGVTPDLKLKPEIAGVGGSIYSAVDPAISGVYYGYMSGTSMACPQIAGAMAVLVQYLDENFPEITGSEQRRLAANLLMSTANPVMATDLLEYSPRHQGAGLADLVKATTTAAYLSNPAASEGRPKVEFGDDPQRIGEYAFSFTITNISDEAVSYTLDSSVMTESILGGWFIANAPYGLEARVQMPELVEVPAGETVIVNATLTLTENDKAYLEQFPNGIYVEGYVYANPVEADGVRLAMPMVGFYGDWSDAPIFDEPEEENASLYPSVVFTYYSQLGTNPYFRNGKAGPAYNAFSYKNLLAEIDFGMLRNAKYMSITVTDKENPDVVYYTEEGFDLRKTHYNPTYGMIIPMYLLADYGEVWDGMDHNGNRLPDGTSVVYTFEAWLDDGDDVMDDTWSFEVTVDDANPELLNENDLQSAMRIDGDRTYLTLDILENEHVAAVVFMAPNGTIMGKYEIENVPGETFTQEFDITGFGGEFTIIVADYACNETEVDVYLNLGAQNNAVPAPVQLDKDRIYGSETFDSAMVEGGWFSANKSDFSDPRNETFDASNRYYSAEFVNGYIIAQSAATGHLELITPSGTYWSSKVIAQNQGQIGDPNVWVLYDMALDHSGTLSAAYGVNWETDATDSLLAVGWLYQGDTNNDGRDDGYNALFNIKFTNYGYVNVQPIARLAGTSTGADLLTLGITTEGLVYGIDTNGILYSVANYTEWDSEVGEYGDNVIRCTEIGVTDFVNYPNYGGANVIQSMGYDHNTGTMYWFAHSQIPSGYTYENINVTYTVNLETAECTEVGTYGPGGQTSLFIPNDLESDLFVLGVDATNMEITPYEKYMAVGQTDRLKINWQPWNAAPKDVTWTSLNEEIVTVDEYGFITALAEGEAIITASAEMMLEGYWEVIDGNWIWIDPAMGVKTVQCVVKVLPSQDALYGFVVEDFATSFTDDTWYTYSDYNPTDETNLGQQLVSVTNPDTGESFDVPARWYGGTYYNGYVYTITEEQWIEDNTVYRGSVLYRSPVAKGETPAETVIGEPEKIGVQPDMVITAMAFDYNTGRMYCVENQYIGGLGIIDLDTGKVDMLGQPNGDLYGGVYILSMCVTADGTIVISDALHSLYTINPDTLTTRMIHQGNGSPYTAFYSAMTYDYNTGNIYFNPCEGSGTSDLYAVLLPEYEWGSATLVDLGGVGTKAGTQQTVLFTIPENEPETKHIPVESIEITNGDKVVGLEGGQLQLGVVTNPARPSLQAKTWTSSDESVVTVDQYGVITYVGIGTATVTVSITNKDEAAHGGPFTDTVTVEVKEAAGEFVAFLNSDEGGTQYYDFWLRGNDYDLRHTAVEESMIAIYSLRTGAYYDGYFYGYTDKGQFLRIDAENPANYKVLGNADLDYNNYQVTGMAMDYTTGIMYGLTMTSNYSFQTWMDEQHVGQLVTIDMDTGYLTAVADLDFNAPVFALACDSNGQLYAAGGSLEYYNTTTKIYKLDKQTAEQTEYLTIDGANVFTGTSYYGSVQYNTQMAYDFGTNRIYMYATSDHQYYSDSFGMYMIELGEEPVAAYLDGISLDLRGDTKIGEVYLGLLAFIPEAEEIPVSPVNGIILNKNSGRISVGSTTQLTAQVRPSNAANTDVTWKSSDKRVAVVDRNGLVTAVSEGTAIITVTSKETGVSATCLITVADVSGPQNMAYTVSADEGALIAFNPAMPAQTAQVIVKMAGGTSIKGMAYGDNCLYYLTNENWVYRLYKFDFSTNSSTFLGELYLFGEPSGLAYDAANNLFYATSGFYLFQYDGNSLDPNNFNFYTNYVMDPDYCTLAGVAIIDGAIYTFGNDYYNGLATMSKYTDIYYLSDRTVVLYDFQLPLVAGATDITYDAGSGLIYAADPGHTIYTMDLEGNVATIDILGDGLDLNGFAIDPTAKYQVTFTDGVDGEELFADQVYFVAPGGQLPMFVGTPQRTGYTFAGWNANTETVDGNMVIKALWTPNTYTITLDPSGGELADREMEAIFNAPIGQLPVPVKAGHTFGGWIDRFGNIYTEKTVFTQAEDLFLIAIWTVNNYTLTLNAGNGEPNVVITVTYGEPIGQLPEPVKAGHTFLGWVDAKGNPVTGDMLYTLESNSALIATWRVNRYTVNLDANGGRVSISSKQVSFGSAIGFLPMPIRDGFRFDGWLDANGNLVTAETVFSLTEDITLTASWSVHSYTLTFDANGGTVESGSVTVTYGAAVGELPKPVREGFSFAGWYLADGTKVTANTVYRVDGDSTLIAHWTALEDVPPTSDFSGIFLALAGLSALAACAMVFASRKRREQN